MNSLRDFLAHAITLEFLAAARYQDLTEQMEAHHNVAAAEVFRRLAADESAHAASLKALYPDVVMTRAAWDYQWSGAASPEEADAAAVDYMLTPYMALELALENERRAEAFFTEVARTTANDKIRELALAFAHDERGHAALVEAELAELDRATSQRAAGHDRDPPRLID